MLLAFSSDRLRFWTSCLCRFAPSLLLSPDTFVYYVFSLTSLIPLENNASHTRWMPELAAQDCGERPSPFLPRALELIYTVAAVICCHPLAERTASVNFEAPHSAARKSSAVVNPQAAKLGCSLLFAFFGCGKTLPRSRSGL